MAVGKTEKEASAEGGDRKDVKNGEELSDAVQKAMTEELEKGYRGANTDPTPNENYTVKGVTSGAPTPETDPELAEKVGSAKFAGEHVVGTYED